MEIEQNSVFLLFSYLRMKTDKFSNMKQKDLKIKNDDILSNIFKNNNDIKKEKSENEIDNKIFLVELIIKYLCANYYLKISQKYIENVFRVEIDLSAYDQNSFNINNIFIFLKQNEYMNYQAIKSISNKINPIISVKLINELKLIFTVIYFNLFFILIYFYIYLIRIFQILKKSIIIKIWAIV